MTPINLLKEFISLFENPINKKSYKIAVALSKKNKVEGIFSRGDLRRTLIKKINLNQPLKKFLNIGLK